VYRVLGSPSGIFSAPADGSAPPVALLDGYQWDDSMSFQLTPDGKRVVMTTSPAPITTTQLWSAPSDGSLPTQLLFSGPSTGLPGGRLAPDGTHGVVRSNEQLVRVTLDGSAPPLVLTTPPPTGQSVIQYQVSPDSGSVVFLQDRGGAGQIELFVVPLDAS